MRRRTVLTLTLHRYCVRLMYGSPELPSDVLRPRSRTLDSRMIVVNMFLCATPTCSRRRLYLIKNLLMVSTIHDGYSRCSSKSLSWFRSHQCSTQRCWIATVILVQCGELAPRETLVRSAGAPSRVRRDAKMLWLTGLLPHPFQLLSLCRSLVTIGTSSSHRVRQQFLLHLDTENLMTLTS